MKAYLLVQYIDGFALPPTRILLILGAFDETIGKSIQYHKTGIFDTALIAIWR